MSDVATLLKEFVDELGAGLQPDAALFIERAETDEDRRELAGLIDLALTIAPTSSTHPRERGGRFVAPISRKQIESLVDETLGERRSWADLLPGLFRERDLSPRKAAEQTLVQGGFEPTGERVAAAERWLDGMSRGLVGFGEVSWTALTALATVLGVPREQLAGGPGEPDGKYVLAMRASRQITPELEDKLNAVTDMLDEQIQRGPADEVDAWFSS